MSSRYTVISLQKRLLAIIIAITFFLCLIFARLLFVMVISGDSLEKKALSQWYRDLPLNALRGNFYDRNGVALAYSYTTYNVFVRPSEVEDKNALAKILVGISNKYTFDEYVQKISTTISEVAVLKQLSYDEVYPLIESKFKGVYLTESSSREYPYSDLLSKILGYVSDDGLGQAGLELFYNNLLKGVDGVKLTETDIVGRSTTGNDEYIAGISGLNLNLTIDFALQLFVEETTEKALSETGAKAVTALVMQPKTGEILAMSSTPSFDLTNIPRDDLTLLNSLSRNSIVCDVYEPGSTFKTLTAAIAMQEGLTSLGDGFYCGGCRVVNGVKIHCHRKTGHGPLSFIKGFNYSCNCVFMELVSRIGLDKFYKYLDLFNFTSTQGIDFPGETTSVIMDKSLVQPFDLARMGFGQTIAVSPLALVNAICSVINGGNLMKPFFVKSVSSANGDIAYINNPSIIRNLFSSNTSDNMNIALKEVIESAGGKNIQIEGYSIGGKTGTAQKYENGAISQNKYVASFYATYPYDDPNYIVMFIIDEPQGVYYGNIVCAPYLKNILQFIFDNYDILPDVAVSSDARASVVVPNLIGKSLTEAVSKLAMLGLDYLTQGEGGFVGGQIAPEGTVVFCGDVVVLMLE